MNTWDFDCRILIAVCFMVEFFHVQLVSIGFDSWQVRTSTDLQLGPLGAGVSACCRGRLLTS